MDHDRGNKSIVCFFQDLMQKRVFFIILSVIGVVMAGGVWLEFNGYLCCLASRIFTPFAILVTGLLFIAINPNISIIKLIGFLISIGACFINANNLSKIDANMLYIMIVFGFFLFYLLLNWFVYSLISSKANKI